MTDPRPTIDEATLRLRALRDPALPAMESLLGPDAPALIDSAVPPAPGDGPPSVARISWRPGRSLVVLYRRPTSDPATGERMLVARTEVHLEWSLRAGDRLDRALHEGKVADREHVARRGTGGPDAGQVGGA